MVTTESSRDDAQVGRALERPSVEDLLRRFGFEAVSFLALKSGMSYWFDTLPPQGTGACVAHVDTGSEWVALGSPLVKHEELVRAASRFVDAAANRGRRACFFASERLEGEGFERMLIGEQPIYRRALWRKALGEHRGLREQLRRARAKGVRVRRVDASELREGGPLRAEVERLADEWLLSRSMVPMAFLLALEPFQLLGEHRYFVAERGARAVGFLSLVPIYARGGWLIEDMLRGRDAPNGASEALFDAVMNEVAETDFVTLGLAPLTGPVAPWLRAVRTVSRPLYSFSGLRAFKEKLRPLRWDPVWLVHPRSESSTLHLMESLRAFAGGSLVAFGLRSLVRRPSVPPFALAVPLAPWTLFLAGLVLAHQQAVLGFSRHALLGWTLFDAALLIVLVLAALRPRNRLLIAATVAASIDAIFSIVHLCAVGLGPTSHHAMLRVLSTAAPCFGVVVLAWAIRSLVQRCETRST